jgi:23S rRNA (uracil1939-C5)-methyltransferase
MSYVVERLGHLGDGIARGPEGPIFVAQALPGEVVAGEIVADRLADPVIITPSPNRVRPPCPHYRTCGGCIVQHASDEFVADWKAEIIRTALAAQGIQAALRKTHTSPARSRRRAVVAGRRTKKAATVGFHTRARDTVVEIADCQLLRPELINTLPTLRKMTELGASRKGEISFALTLSDAGVEIAASGGKEPDPALFEALGRLAHDADLPRLAWNDVPIASRRPCLQSFGTVQVTPPAGAFLQATKEGEATLVALVREALGNAAQIADLFSGCGTFALPLADTASVHAVEGVSALIGALDAGWRGANGLKPVTSEVRDLFRRPLLSDELNRFDAIVLDPPRAGAQAQVEQLAASRVPLIAYVSCNPISFARDARALLGAGYAIDWIDVVDQFRWSSHVELVARFHRHPKER